MLYIGLPSVLNDIEILIAQKPGEGAQRCCHLCANQGLGLIFICRPVTKSIESVDKLGSVGLWEISLPLRFEIKVRILILMLKEETLVSKLTRDHLRLRHDVRDVLFAGEWAIFRHDSKKSFLALDVLKLLVERSLDTVDDLTNASIRPSGPKVLPGVLEPHIERELDFAVLDKGVSTFLSVPRELR